MTSFKAFLAEASVLTKLKTIFAGGELKGSGSANLPAVIEPKKRDVVDQSKRNMLKRSAASTLARTVDMTPLSALAKLIQLEPTVKPYKLVRSGPESFEIDGMWTIEEDQIEECRGDEAILKKWCAMAKKAMASKKLEDVMKLLDETEGEGPDLFGGETYNGWLVDLAPLEEDDFNQDVLTDKDKELFDDNIFADDAWKKLSPKAQAELSKTILNYQGANLMEYIWTKCDVVLTVLPLIDGSPTSVKVKAEKAARAPAQAAYERDLAEHEKVSKVIYEAMEKRYKQVFHDAGRGGCSRVYCKDTYDTQEGQQVFTHQYQARINPNWYPGNSVPAKSDKLCVSMYMPTKSDKPQHDRVEKVVDTLDEAFELIDKYVAQHGGISATSMN